MTPVHKQQVCSMRRGAFSDFSYTIPGALDQCSAYKRHSNRNLALLGMGGQRAAVSSAAAEPNNTYPRVV